MRWLRSILLAAAVSTALTGCGGGLRGADEPAQQRALSTVTGETTLAATPAVSPAVSANDAAEQLLDLAEQTYPNDFSPGPITLSFVDFRYRFYPATGLYLGVVTSDSPSGGYRSGGVYLMGSDPADAPQYVNQLTAFLTPVSAEMRAAPSLSLTFLRTLPHSPKGLGEPCSNRSAWAVEHPDIEQIMIRARRFLDAPFPVWDSDAYAASALSGNSAPGDTMLAARKNQLYPLVIAECLTWNGTYLPRIEEVLRGLAQQPSWASPTTDREARMLRGDYYVELHASATATEIAEAMYLLGDKIPSGTRGLLMSALKTRIFDPMRAAVDQGRDASSLTRQHNWNAAVVGGVVNAALTVLPSRYERAWFASVGQHYIQNYFLGFPESGYALEGPNYWDYGMTNLSLLRQALFQASAGAVDLLDSPKAQAAALYCVKFATAPQRIAAPFGDAVAGSQLNGPVTVLLAAAFGTPDSGWPQSASLRAPYANAHYLPLASLILTRPAIPMVATHRTSEFMRPGLHSAFADAGVLVSRSPTTEAKAMGAAIKGGGSITHSHDDIGSYSIVVDAAVVAGDPGIGAYTSRTFSSQRRTVKWINSFGHPVPVIGGRLQLDASGTPNRVLGVTLTDAADEMRVDLAPAYGLPAGSALVRTFRNDRMARTISIKDEFSAAAAETFEVPVITLGTWTRRGPSELVLSHAGESVRVVIEASAPFDLVAESVTDDGLSLQRIAVRLTGASRSGWVKTSYSRSE